MFLWMSSCTYHFHTNDNDNVHDLVVLAYTETVFLQSETLS